MPATLGTRSEKKSLSLNVQAPDQLDRAIKDFLGSGTLLDWDLC